VLCIVSILLGYVLFEREWYFINKVMYLFYLT